MKIKGIYIPSAAGYLAAILLLILALCAVPVRASADDADTFSVTLPSSLPIEVDSNNNVICATNLLIKNNKTGPIAVSSIKIEGVNGWTLTDFGTDYARKTTDIKEFGLVIAGKEVPEDGNADLSGIPFIEGMGSFNLTYDANVAVQTSSLSNEVIGQVLFTVGWQEGQIYSLTITKAPDKVDYFSGESFDPTGMVITATYYGGAQEVLNNYQIINGTSLKTGQTGVTISVTNDYGSSRSVVCPVNVNRLLSSIRLMSGPDKKTYSAGEKFSSDGMVVEAVYADGTTQIVDNYVCSPATVSKTTKTVNVSYTENGVTKSLQVSVEVKKSTDVSEATVVLSSYEFEYDGTAKKPSAQVVLDSVVLTEGTDYSLSYENNVNAGTGKAVVSGIGNYTGKYTVEFTITKKATVLTVNWSDLTFTCDNTEKVPSATLSGLKDGDAATVSVEGGAYVPGSHTATAVVTMTSGDLSDYRIENSECTFVINAGQAPKLSNKPTYMQLKNAGLYSINSGATIGCTEIVSCHTPESGLLMSANLDASGTGSIKGYIYPMSNGAYRLVISGNGADKIYCNENSMRAFAYLANNYGGSSGYISGIEMLDMSYVTKADYMFANISLGDFTFPYMSFPAMTQCYYMFSKISAGNLTVTGMYAPNLTATTYMFWYSNITGKLDISGICTTGVNNMQYMFAEGVFGYLDLNGLDTSSVNSFSSMFENASVGALKINSWNTSAGQNFKYMFRGFNGNGMSINMSSWNMSGATICEYMFTNIKGVPSVYFPNNLINCAYFTGMFGGASSSITTIYSQADFIIGNQVDTTQQPCADNPNFSVVYVTDLKLTTNGGIITYSPPISD